MSNWLGRFARSNTGILTRGFADVHEQEDTESQRNEQSDGREMESHQLSRVRWGRAGVNP
jgi:hypothetical protein